MDRAYRARLARHHGEPARTTPAAVPAGAATAGRRAPCTRTHHRGGMREGVVPEPGLEPGRRQRRQAILSPRRLPVPPLRHACSICRGDAVRRASRRDGEAARAGRRDVAAASDGRRCRGGSAAEVRRAWIRRRAERAGDEEPGGEGEERGGDGVAERQATQQHVGPPGTDDVLSQQATGPEGPVNPTKFGAPRGQTARLGRGRPAGRRRRSARRERAVGERERRALEEVGLADARRRRGRTRAQASRGDEGAGEDDVLAAGLDARQPAALGAGERGEARRRPRRSRRASRTWPWTSRPSYSVMPSLLATSVV